ncbi:unnamed protein product [Zymoseptoria tritici ST99CH_1A5]|uniref:Uncharacterized protein n=1 Tax=Zymoseptoria tritici ST99CH_1A5 TaxID=1276529 RepID=A0A1Y6M1L9_ZYMTR|nr:unnamed protein product [Zymoseptoria tritici ST99CH_1A5]
MYSVLVLTILSRGIRFGPELRRKGARYPGAHPEMQVLLHHWRRNGTLPGVTDPPRPGRAHGKHPHREPRDNPRTPSKDAECAIDDSPMSHPLR